MSDRQIAVLRPEPRMIPDLRNTFDDALDELAVVLMQLRDNELPEPWLGDAVSADVAARHDECALGPSQSALVVLGAYQAELLRVRDSLQQLENHHRTTEGDNAALWGRQA